MRPQLALSLCLLTFSAFVGCAPDAETANCDKASQCKELDGETTEQCQANAYTCISLLEQADSTCQALATAMTNYDNCMAGLSCDDRTDSTNSCSSKAAAVTSAQTAAVAASCPCTATTSPY